MRTAQPRPQVPPESLADRLARVREAIAAACARADREPDAVRIVAITKGHPAETLRAALEAGLRDVGENRVQEALAKFGEVDAALVAADARRHLVGHLQRNKALDAVRAFDWIQSVDSVRLARALAGRRAPEAGPLETLLQVNPAGEEQKHGFEPAAAVEGALEIAGLPNLRLRGLMAMAPWTGDEAVLRRAFATVRRLFEALRRSASDPAPIDTLSMGMSNDYPLAVEEGATMLRLGTVLLGERSPTRGA